jgi:hypothetical protein
MCNFKKISLVLFLSGFVIVAGCSFDDTLPPEDVEVDIPASDTAGSDTAGSDFVPYTDLPNNPSVPANPSGTSRQLWYFGYKSYDNTYRIRWPTYFATELNIGPGSYTTVNGERARFRSFDTDNNSNRPSYTIPAQRGTRFRGEVLCILYNKNDQPIAWFRTSASGRSQGSLP